METDGVSFLQPLNGNMPAPTMTSLAALRTQRQSQWLKELRLALADVLETSLKRPDQIYLFGSRARGDWDGLSDTDLLVVAANHHEANVWVDRLLDAGLAEDVIGLDRESWAQLRRASPWSGATRPMTHLRYWKTSHKCPPDCMAAPSP